jgi:formylglycine-generating enzyme required for sulfatase activity
MERRFDGHKNLWERLASSIKAAFQPNVYAGEVLATEQAARSAQLLEVQVEIDRKRLELHQLSLMLQDVQQRDNFSFIPERAEFDRDLEVQLVRWQKEFYERHNLIESDRDEKLEVMKINFRRWILERQKELQLELQQSEIDIVLAQREIDRQNAPIFLQEQKQQYGSPIWPIAEDILNTYVSGETIPLRIFFSPPILPEIEILDGRTGDLRFPNMEKGLARTIGQFFEQYNNTSRPVEFLAALWTSKSFNSEFAAKAIFRSLKTEPSILLESAIEGETFELNFAFWGINWQNYRYKNGISFSWKEALLDFAKKRSVQWMRHQKERGRLSRSELEGIYGSETVSHHVHNVKIYERERQCLLAGEDPSTILRPYLIHPKDYELLQQFLATCHCLFAGLLADEYFLMHVPPEHRYRPLLPQLLPSLLETIPTNARNDVLEPIVLAYDTLYRTIAHRESSWLPELELDLGESLFALSDSTFAASRIDASIAAWLNLHWIAPTNSTDNLALLAEAVGTNDRDYIEQLNPALVWLNRPPIDIANACYARAIGYYRAGEFAAAIGEFGETLEMNPQWAEALYYRALARIRQEEYTAALTDLSYAIDINPSLGRAYQVRGQIYDRQQNYNAAIDDYERAIGLGVDEVRPRIEAVRRALAASQQAEIDRRDLGEVHEFATVQLDERGIVQEHIPVTVRELSTPLAEGIEMSLVYIPGGKFWMGSQRIHEYPRHLVEVGDFHLGKYPVTQCQWSAIVKLPQIDRPLMEFPASFQGANRPIENISWYDAVEFCRRLSTYTGELYRLPSEAEWEYACRGGLESAYGYGDAISTELANFSGGTSRQETTRVGMFPPNRLGLHDMHGNVWEWCADYWHESYEGAPTDGKPWVTGGDSSYRVLRGGSWFNNQWNCRCSNRNWVHPEITSWLYGFRIVRDGTDINPHS